MKPRLAAVLVLALVGLAIGARFLLRSTSTEADAWALLAPEMPVHRCAAPAAPAYAARDVHWVHASDGGIAMATPQPSGVNALLGLFEPIGTLRWSPKGCEVTPVETRSITVDVTEADGTPATATVVSCPWDSMRTSAEGTLTLEVPVGVRCKLAAFAIEGDSFRQSEPQPVADDVDHFTLVINGRPTAIAARQQATRDFLAFLAQDHGKGPYERALDGVEDPVIEGFLLDWQGQYEARQTAAIERLQQLAATDDGWIQLSR